MKIYSDRIPAKGLEIDFSEAETWVPEKLSLALHENYHPEDPVQGHLSLFKTLNNISFSADIDFQIHATCGRCVKDFSLPMHVHCERLLTTREEIRGEPGAHESEEDLPQEDLNFGLYNEDDEIDFGAIIAEQVVLEQPIIYYCKPDCKGLCPQCGVDRNLKTCNCSTPDLEKSPFAVLKKLKKE